MSFLPYARPSSGAWALSVGGSAALHLSLVGLMLTSSVVLLPAPITNLPSAPEFEITLEILDADIIDLTQEDTRFDIPEDAVPLLPEETTTALLEPDQELQVSPDESTQTLLPDAPLEPLPADDAATEPEVLPPILPDDDGLAIDDISPITQSEISPLAEAVAPVAMAPDEVLISPDQNTDSDIVAITLPEPEPLTEPEVLEPSAAIAEPPTEALVPDGPPTDPEANQTQVVANPGPDMAMIGTLIKRIRAETNEPCALALPRRVGADKIGVSFIGSQSDQLDRLANTVLEGLSPAPIQTREVLDPRQCALLDAIRQIADYPAGRIGLLLDDTSLLSGETLRGRVSGAGGLTVALLLIDDNGVVQDLQRFTAVNGNDLVFDAPVARSGPRRATRQVLLALGSRSETLDLTALIGQDAETVFTSLPGDQLRQFRFGLTTFDVQ